VEAIMDMVKTIVLSPTALFCALKKGELKPQWAYFEKRKREMEAL